MSRPVNDAGRWLDRTHAGDCRQLLKRMSQDGVQVQMCVTSPPYFGLRSYLPAGHPDKRLEIGRQITVRQYIRDLVDVFRAVRQVLADDATLWIVIGDTYAATRTWQAPGTRGGPKHAAAQQAAGGMRTGDGLKSVADRCTRSHEYLFLFAKNRHYYFDQDAIREPSTDPRGPGNTRPVSAPPGERASSGNANLRGSLQKIGARSTRNSRDVWTIASKPFRGGHFAVFPDTLVAPCILAGSRTGDTVLDPFMGSGTTAVAALRLQRHFIGCELNRSFIDLQHLH